MANYLYGPNKIPLPALPEWDKAIYPYALIEHYDFDDGTTGNFLYVFSTPFVTVDLTEQYGYVSVQVEDGGKYMYWAYYPDRETEWMGANIPITSDSWETRTTKIAWANTDIYNPDGTLYLAASEPIPVGTAPALDPLSLFLGWKAGNWVARQRGKAKPPEEEKTPVVFLYNGVGLPDINAVWTDEMKALYPYAYMYEIADFGAYAIIFVSFEMYKDGKQIFAKTAGGGIYAMYLPGEYDDWESDGIEQEVKENELMFDEEAEFQLLTAVIWTSHDILNADGTVYLAASEPVPVYE